MFLQTKPVLDLSTGNNKIHQHKLTYRGQLPTKNKLNDTKMNAEHIAHSCILLYTCTYMYC